MVAVFVDDIIVGYDRSATDACMHTKAKYAELIKIGSSDIQEVPNSRETALRGFETGVFSLLRKQLTPMSWLNDTKGRLLSRTDPQDLCEKV